MYETKRSPDRYHLLYEGWSSHKIRFFLARTRVINNISINCVVHTVNSCFEETLRTVMDKPMIRIADNFHYKLVRYEIKFRWTLDMALFCSLKVVRIDGVDNCTSQGRFPTRNASTLSLREILR